MKVNPPIVRILKKMKTEDGVSAFDALVSYLYDIEKMSVLEIAAVLDVGDGGIYTILRRRKEAKEK